jgi:hypothetical protein
MTYKMYITYILKKSKEDHQIQDSSPACAETQEQARNLR